MFPFLYYLVYNVINLINMNGKIINQNYKYKPIRTKRLLLIKPTLKYKTELLNLYLDKRIWIYNGAGENKYSIDDIITQIKKRRNLWVNKKMISFFIIYENKFVGTIGLNNISPDFRNAQIGFILNPDYWNKGIMSEALSEFMKFTFKNTNLFRISVSVCAKNKSSIKVLTKNQFRKEGLLKKSSIFNGKIYDNYIYAVIDYNKLK